MNTSLFHRRRAERFAQLLDEAHGGRRHHVRTRLDAQLAELVAIGHQAGTLRPAVELDPEFRSGLRSLLLATAEREGIGVTARPTEQPAPPAIRRAASSSASSRIRARGAIVVGVAVGAIAVSGMSAASENAVPGDALYRVKRSTERAQLALASSDVTRGQLYLDFAHTRIAEATAVRADSAGFKAVLDDMDADTRQGVKLLTTAAGTHGDPTALDAVDSFATTQRLELASVLDQVPTANRPRTMGSLALLDAVTKRSDALRNALSCGGSPTAGADRLGPKPRECSGAARPDDGDRENTLHNGPTQPGPPARSQPEKDASNSESDSSPLPADKAAAPAAAAGDAGTAAGSAGAAAEPIPAEQPVSPFSGPPAQEEDLLGDVGRVLDGLLG